MIGANIDSEFLWQRVHVNLNVYANPNLNRLFNVMLVLILMDTLMSGSSHYTL